jgi:hypothetical protein
MSIRGEGNRRPWRRKPVCILAAGFFLVSLLVLAPYPFSLIGDIVTASAHHTRDSDVQVLLEGTQQGHHVTLEVAPRELIAGSVAEFSLWMWRIGPGSPYTGRVRLSMQTEGGSTTSESDIPISERGRGGVSVLYRGTHRFEQEGAYRLNLEMADLRAGWTATLRVYPAATWYSAILQPVSAIGLTIGSLFFLLALLLTAGAKGTRWRLPWPGSKRS